MTHHFHLYVEIWKVEKYNFKKTFYKHKHPHKFQIRIKICHRIICIENLSATVWHKQLSRDMLFSVESFVLFEKFFQIRFTGEIVPCTILQGPHFIQGMPVGVELWLSIRTNDLPVPMPVWIQEYLPEFCKKNCARRLAKKICTGTVENNNDCANRAAI